MKLPTGVARNMPVASLNAAQEALLDYQIEREEQKLQPETFTLTFTRDELVLIQEALDSHVYWQLSDEENRHSGFVYYDDGEEPEEVTEANALHDRLEAIAPPKAVG